MEAQAKALEGEQQALTEDGWKEVVIGRREEIQDRLYAMDVPEREFDEPTTRKLSKLANRRAKLEKTAEKIYAISELDPFLGDRLKEGR